MNYSHAFREACAADLPLIHAKIDDGKARYINRPDAEFAFEVYEGNMFILAFAGNIAKSENEILDMARAMQCHHILLGTHKPAMVRLMPRFGFRTIYTIMQRDLNNGR